MSTDEYERTQLHPFDEPDLILDDETLDTLWGLFENIGVYWKNVDDSSGMKSQWLVFLDNRIRTNPTYAYEYRAGARLLRKMLADLGDDAYAYLFTSASATISPPSTPLSRLRQLVSNEFIDLQLALGGFKAFGAKNYLGYFGGSNIPGAPAPYRTAAEEGA